MTTFITSDFHFNHDKMAHLRGFESTEAMNEHLIKHWNETVKRGDTIYHLGDFCFKPATTFKNVLCQLNGKIIFILGNHDNPINFIEVDNLRYLPSDHPDRFDINMQFSTYSEIKYGNYFIALFHFPITIWNGIADGSLHFHGHTHGGHQGEGRCMDVGYDMHNRILTMEEAIDMVKDKPIIKRHYKK